MSPSSPPSMPDPGPAGAAASALLSNRSRSLAVRRMKVAESTGLTVSATSSEATSTIETVIGM